MNDTSYSRVGKFCIVATVYFWIYSGFIRINIFPQFALYLYFFPALMILIAATRHFLTHQNYDIKFKKIIYLYFVVAIFFQVIHLFQLNITLTVAIYGLTLYQIPTFLFLFIDDMKRYQFGKIFERIIIWSATPNTIFCFLQTSTHISYFQKSLNGGALLGTTYGVNRAFGTFSSTTGFSAYLIILIAIVMTSEKERTFLVKAYIWICISIMVSICGSRTVYFTIPLILLPYLIHLLTRADFRQIKSFLGLIIGLISGIVIANYFAKFILVAFWARFTQTTTKSSTASRLTDGMFSYFSHINQPLFGQGMGSTGTGALLYQNAGNWIEQDLPKIIVECGPILGLILILGRYLLLASLIYFIFKGNIVDRWKNVCLFSAVIPSILFGQLVGQGSISIGTWLVCALVLLKILPDNPKRLNDLQNL